MFSKKLGNGAEESVESLAADVVAGALQMHDLETRQQLDGLASSLR